jgi:hypothetical protein
MTRHVQTRCQGNSSSFKKKNENSNARLVFETAVCNQGAAARGVSARRVFARRVYSEIKQKQQSSMSVFGPFFNLPQQVASWAAAGSEECAICQESLADPAINGGPVVLQPCFHVMHRFCWLRAAETARGHICPECRAPVVSTLPPAPAPQPAPVNKPRRRQIMTDAQMRRIAADQAHARVEARERARTSDNPA